MSRSRGTPPIRYFEDFHPGQQLECAERTVTREEILRFAEEFDPQPFHLDEEAARHSVFGGLVASGWHICGILMRILVDSFMGQAASLASPGVDEIRWLKPVRPGDRLRLHVVVLEAIPSRSKPDRGILRFRCKLFNQRNELVTTVVSLAIMGRRSRT